MDEESNLQKIESIFSLLSELSTKREEHFDFFEQLIKKSEESVDRIYEMTMMLAKAMNQSCEEKKSFVDLHCKHKSELIVRYEKKLERAENRFDEAQKQNSELVKEISLLNRQIEKMEDILIMYRNNDNTRPQQINVGNIRPNGGG